VIGKTGPRGLGAAGLAACLLLAGFAPSAFAERLVTTNSDGPGNGTLRHEIQTAANGETVTIQPGINPVITMGEIPIVTDIILRGQGAAATLITVNAGTPSRVGHILLAAPSDTVTIRDLAVTGAHAADGGPGLAGANGGAFDISNGQLIVDQVKFSNNHAGDGGDGSDGSDSITNGGNGNAGGGGGIGGAIWVDGTAQLTVTNSSFESNFGGAGGDGGDGGDGSTGNGGNGANGFIGGSGGAIYSTSTGTISITNSTFTSNNAGAGGHGGNAGAGNTVADYGTAGQGGTGGAGGAIDKPGPTGTLNILGSTFSSNVAGNGGSGGSVVGGIGNGGIGGGGGHAGGVKGQTMSVVNSTFRANQAGTGGSGGGGTAVGAGGGGGSGGAIDATGTVSINSATVAQNLAGGGGSGSSAGSNGFGGGIEGASAYTLLNSIVASNTAAGSTFMNCAGFVPTGTNNLSFPAANNGCPGTVGDPLLGILQDNSGPTKTMALGAGSAALDAVPSNGAGCVATDQRGISRPQGLACDVGAFEVVVPVPPGPAQPITKKKKCKKKKKKHHAAAAKKKKCKKRKKR
jgi:hypothetical protein